MRNIDINKIKPRLLDLYHKLDKKGFLFALLVTFFIFIPLELTFVSIFTKKGNEILSYFNIDSVIVLSSICSLIVNNWLKGDNGSEREDLINLVSSAVFLFTLVLFLIFSFFFSIYFFLYGNKFLVTVHLLIFLVVVYFTLAIDFVMKKFNECPYMLYMTLWSILLFSYILYGILFKYLNI